MCKNKAAAGCSGILALPMQSEFPWCTEPPLLRGTACSGRKKSESKRAVQSEPYHTLLQVKETQARGGRGAVGRLGDAGLLVFLLFV